MRNLALVAVTLACLVARSAGARAEGPMETLDLDEATRARCLGVLRGGLESEEFWPSMHAAEALTLDGRGSEARALLGPKLPKETDDQRRCGLARELARAGDRAPLQVMLDILASPNPHGHVHACESLFKLREVG